MKHVASLIVVAPLFATAAVAQTSVSGSVGLITDGITVTIAADSVNWQGRRVSGDDCNLYKGDRVAGIAELADGQVLVRQKLRYAGKPDPKRCVWRTLLVMPKAVYMKAVEDARAADAAKATKVGKK